MGNRRDMEDRIIIHRRVEAGVVAEGALGPHLPRLNIPLDHKVTLGGDFQRLSDTFHKVD